MYWARTEHLALKANCDNSTSTKAYSPKPIFVKNVSLFVVKVKASRSATCLKICGRDQGFMVCDMSYYLW